MLYHYINCAFPSPFFPLPPSPLSVSPPSLPHSSVFITLITGTWGGDTVIQGIICLIGAISHPMLLCQTAVFLWSLPVFTVACRGRALSGTEGLSTQQRRVFQSLSGVLGLISRGSFSLSSSHLLAHTVPSPGLLPALFSDRRG